MPFVSNPVKALLALTLFSQTTFAQDAALTACPAPGTIYATTTGSRYATCPGTDYQGPNESQLTDITTIEACVQACEQEATCLKVVYSAAEAICSFKSNDDGALTWTANANFTTVYLANDLPEKTDIAQCPFVQTVYVAATANYTVCPDTDYRGDSIQQIKDIADTMGCVNQCAGTDGCKRAVYDTADKICHIKGDPTENTLVWRLDKRFDTIRMDEPAAPATQGQWSDMIRFPVIPVAAYVVPQVPESTRLLMFSSWGPTEFGGASGMTQFADFDFVS